MFIICDSSNVVQDKASSEANLNRGYNYPDYKMYEILNTLDARIGDSYDGRELVINERLRIDKSLRAIKMEIVNISIKNDKAIALQYDDIADEYTAERIILEAEKARLESERISPEIIS